MRILLPIDFDPSRGISVPGIFSAVYYFFWDERDIGPWSVSLWQIFLLVWSVGAVWNVLRFLYGYCRELRRVERLEAYCPEQTERVCNLMDERTGKRAAGRILCSPAIHIPAGIGLFRRRIIMPDIDCTDEELYYILLHECTHFRNGDLFLKFGLQVIRCVFWWNPSIQFLQKELSQALEIRCDLTVTKRMSRESISEYMCVICFLS